MADENNDGTSNGAGSAREASETPKQQFAIQKVYLKDASLETPATPEIFQEGGRPEARVELNSRRHALSGETYEVVLTVTVTAKVGERTAYLCEVQQAGLFALRGFPEAATDQLLGSYCPNVLFAYAREAVSDLTGKAGFPPMLLAPVNFDALYARQRARQESAGEGAESAQSTGSPSEAGQH